MCAIVIKNNACVAENFYKNKNKFLWILMKMKRDDSKKSSRWLLKILPQNKLKTLLKTISICIYPN